jgi:predicted enzyme related to lactoylglutathione lyase
LKGILGVVNRPEHAVAVRVQLTAIWIDRARERLLVARPCPLQNAVRDRRACRSSSHRSIRVDRTAHETNLSDEFARPQQSQSQEMHPARVNRVIHLELHTRELAHARALYGELLGWQAEQICRREGSYVALELGSSLSGGMVQCPTGRALWLPYVEVSDVRDTLDRARGLGAAVLLEPREGPGGWRSVVSTSCGGELAFWQAKR